ncbi:MAG: hypothetical protein CL912_07240 [Deltaproteobacteria bacterium]|nr:hypothetical protein [Deltaproteobacteria bacterium]
MKVETTDDNQIAAGVKSDPMMLLKEARPSSGIVRLMLHFLPVRVLHCVIRGLIFEILRGLLSVGVLLSFSHGFCRFISSRHMYPWSVISFAFASPTFIRNFVGRPISR